MGIDFGDKERYQRYLCSREWAILREYVRKRCDGVCERCMYFEMDHVHHLTYIRKYHEKIEDLQGLCEGCHEFIHGKRDRDPCLDVPVRIFGETVRSVYFAGKFTEPDWRAQIVPIMWHVRYEDQTWENRSFSFKLDDGRSLIYAGPFRYDMGHGRSEGPHRYSFEGVDRSGHGCGPVCFSTDAARVISQCRASIERADLVFAWVDSRECYGTLLEIGFAEGLGKNVVVASPSFDRELWLTFNMCRRHIVLGSALEAWNVLLLTPHNEDHYQDPEDEEYPDQGEPEESYEELEEVTGS